MSFTVMGIFPPMCSNPYVLKSTNMFYENHQKMGTGNHIFTTQLLAMCLRPNSTFVKTQIGVIGS